MKIEVDDIWWLDPRRDALVQKVGFIADAVALRLWRLAAEHWKAQAPIPESQFFAVPCAREFLDVGLAEQGDQGIWVKGAQAAFAWYHEGINQRKEAGRRSAAIRKEKYGSATPINASNGAERKPNEIRTEPNETEPPSPSPSPSPLTTPLNLLPALEQKPSPKPRQSPESLRARAAIKSHWIESYKLRYGFEPSDTNSVFIRSTLKRIHESLGEERAIKAISAYMAWDNPRVIHQAHPIWQMLPNLDSLRAEVTNPKAKYSALARSRAQAKVATEAEQRLEEMLSYARRDDSGPLPPPPQPSAIDLPAGREGLRVVPKLTENRIPEERGELHGLDPEADAIPGWSSFEESERGS